MAFDFSDLEPPADVITAAKNIKKLLKMALTSNDGLSMFVHPVGKQIEIFKTNFKYKILSARDFAA